jgi:hypothetical protein
VPVALTLERRELRRGAYVLLALVLAQVPFLIADPASLLRLMHGIVDLRGTFVLAANVWWPFLPSSPDLTPVQHVLPAWLGVSARPLLIAICVGVPLLLARRVRQDLASRALPLLALVMLLRCVLDPLDNVYYHAPFFAALVAADALKGRLGPSLIAVACISVTVRLGEGSAAVVSGWYLAWSLPMCVYLAGRASGADWTAGWASLRARVAPGRAAPQSAVTALAGVTDTTLPMSSEAIGRVVSISKPAGDSQARE